MSYTSLDIETKKEATNYVKVVALELHIQKEFDKFLRRCSPNLINKFNNYLMMELVDSKRIDNKGIFDAAKFPLVDDEFSRRDALAKEVFELSKLCILVDRHVRQLVYEEGDFCDGKTFKRTREFDHGLYIV